MKHIFVFEIAPPFRWFNYQRLGNYRRVIFLWFSISHIAMSWTEFISNMIRVSEQSLIEKMSKETDREC